MSTATETSSFPFAHCKQDGDDLLVTPWRYRGRGEQPQSSDPLEQRVIYGEPVRLEGVLRTTTRQWSPRETFSTIGFIDYQDTLRRVCELVGHGPEGYCLLTAESGRFWTLSLSAGARLWRVG